MLVNVISYREGGYCHKRIKFLISNYLYTEIEDMKELGNSLELYLHYLIKSDSTKEDVLIINVGGACEFIL